MQFERWVEIDLRKGRNAQIDLGPVLFTGDIDPLKLGVRLKDGGSEVEITGTVTGRAILPSGETISPLEGDQDGNEGWIIVPQSALAYPGKVEIFLRIVDEDTTAVALYATATVKRSTTGTVILPGTPLPDVLDEIEEALTAAQALAEVATVADTTAYLGI